MPEMPGPGIVFLLRQVRRTELPTGLGPAVLGIIVLPARVVCVSHKNVLHDSDLTVSFTLTIT
jgi:hypothetical protein